jgi:tRNA(Ile2) C34 agmatinyltransferase TiaS
MRAVESVLTSPPLIAIAAVLAVVLGFYGVQKYQRCPHCGRVVPRVSRGWLRCASCGRQYRKGLRVR